MPCFYCATLKINVATDQQTDPVMFHQITKSLTCK